MAAKAFIPAWAMKFPPSVFASVVRSHTRFRPVLSATSEPCSNRPAAQPGLANTCSMCETDLMSAVAFVAQPSLFGLGQPSFDAGFSELRRHELSRGAWLDHQPGWLRGHQALFDLLVDVVDWEQHRRPMYDRMVDVPRLTGSLPNAAEGAHAAELAIVEAMAEAISGRYRLDFDRIGIALYRDGNDSVAWHGDQVARELPQAMVATVSLGEPRKFCLRPKGGGPSQKFHLGHGDLMVMGGTCQRTWEHSVPKVASAGPRIALMFRPEWSSNAIEWSPVT